MKKEQIIELIKQGKVSKGRAMKWAKNRKPHQLIGTVVSVRKEKKIGRNEPCHCGSGKKFKKCCIK